MVNFYLKFHQKNIISFLFFKISVYFHAQKCLELRSILVSKPMRLQKNWFKWKLRLHRFKYIMSNTWRIKDIGMSLAEGITWSSSNILVKIDNKYLYYCTMLILFNAIIQVYSRFPGPSSGARCSIYSHWWRDASV